MQKLSDALLIPVWKNRYTGFSGKLFEFIASQDNVLIGPGMQEDVLDFTKEFSNVIPLQDEESFLRFLKQVKKQELLMAADTLVNNKLQRSYWVDKLNLFLLNLKAL